MNIIDFILDLFRNPAAAASFVVDPDGALRDAGLPNVTAAQLASVAATAAPAGYALGGGDPIVGLQRAVADHHQLASNFASPFSPQTSFAPTTELASRNNTDLLSGNSVPIASPNQDAGANAQNGAFNLGFGDITLGDKTSNTATNGGVVVGGDNDGDVLTGDGSMMGDGTNNSGDILAGSGSNVVIGGEDNEVENDSKTAGGDLIDTDGPVINDVDMSGGNGGGADGGGSLLGIGGGNASGGAGGDAGGIVIVDSDTSTNSGTQIGGDYGVETNTDSNNSVESNTSTSTETSVDDNSSSFETNLGSGNETNLGSGNETALGSGNETNTSLFSGNETGIETEIETETDLASNNNTNTGLDAF